MGKKALLFPGQASQYVGMGKDLCESSAEVRRLYELASDEIGEDLARLSAEGPVDELKRTRFTQPAILVHSLAVLTVLGERLPEFDFACGHSLGEYGALAATGALTFEDAIRAVVKRAALMEEACVRNPGTMAAIMGLDESTVQSVCQRSAASGVVVPANYNSQIQVAISGSHPGVERATEEARAAGAKRAVLLEVGGAFHSPLMDSARSGLAEYLEGIELKTPSCPVVANVTARPETDPKRMKQLLVDQVTSPVRWSQTMQHLVEAGVTEIYEIGPGKVLAGLAKRDMRPEITVNLDTLADIDAFAATQA